MADNIDIPDGHVIPPDYDDTDIRMSEHPCAGGLSGACFRAYPEWAKKAFAYKLVHLLVPKQLSKNLPAGLRKALIGKNSRITRPGNLPPSFSPGGDSNIIMPPGTGPGAPDYIMFGKNDTGGKSSPVPAPEPVEVTFTVQAGADDGYTTEGYLYLYNNLEYDCIGYGASDKSLSSFMRFISVSVPPKAEILESHIIFYKYGTAGEGTCNLKILGNKKVNPSAPVIYADYLALEHTSKIVLWSDMSWGGSALNNSPDISEVIQELVNQSGYAQNQAIMLMVMNNETVGEAYRSYQSRNSSAAVAPKLYVKYQAKY